MGSQENFGTLVSGTTRTVKGLKTSSISRKSSWTGLAVRREEIMELLTGVPTAAARQLDQTTQPALSAASKKSSRAIIVQKMRAVGFSTAFSKRIARGLQAKTSTSVTGTQGARNGVSERCRGRGHRKR